MNDPLHWHVETITPGTGDLLGRLAAGILPSGAYLAGGTGLALRFGHRTSVDLDFFVPADFDDEQLLQRLSALSPVAVVGRAPQTLHVTIDGIKVSILGYAYPILYSMEPFRGALVADPRDIACMKLTAIASRGSRRDFIDFYVASQRYGMAELFGLFDRKYARTKYSRLHVLKSLTWFADAEKDPLPHMLVPVDWRDIKTFFTREAPALRR